LGGVRLGPAVTAVFSAAVLAGCAGSADPGAVNPNTANPSMVNPSTATATTAGPEAGRTVSFTSSDGVALTGTLFGSGTTGVVLSNMGDNDPADWQRFASVLSRQGYLVLTYTFRDPARSTAEMGTGTEADLAGAIAYLRVQSADDIVLVGASLGGMATASMVGADGVRAAVVLSSPVKVPGAGYAVDRQALAANTVPILYIAADDDPVVPAADTRRLYELTAGPREWQHYPERAHGSELLDGASAGAVTARITGFLAEHAPIP
jgi:pimeloyl-ACP methyl ester carboxylesterase